MCLEILQNDKKIKITCQTFYVEGVGQTEKSWYPASRLYILTFSPTHVMHPGVSSYGMEADPIWNMNAFWWLTDVI